MTIQRNVSLKPYNTFGIDVKARAFAEAETIEQLRELLQTDEFREMTKLILGGGSNVLLTADFDGLVIKNSIRGIELLEENDEQVQVKVYGGEVWHDFVLYAVERDWGGVENLSLIPGSTGAAPMQNIGAYGVELEEVFDHLEAINLTTGKLETFTHEDCRFGYRNSIFKQELKGEYIIVSVTLLLEKNREPNISYRALQEYLSDIPKDEIDIAKVSEAVMAIRKNKLPNPDEIGNAGSFFKNPEVDQQTFEALQQEHPDIPHYPLSNGKEKIPAGWLIEKCGWKGQKRGQVGSHDKQALVLVNYGGGSGQAIKQLADDVRASVKETFGIELTPEVNIIE
jgi:UDP-N-acetylmuramate dehydrogenase